MLKNSMEKLQAENSRLNSELHDAQSQIFSLQPWRKDLALEEVRLVRTIPKMSCHNNITKCAPGI